jgi:hypothetical protein
VRPAGLLVLFQLPILYTSPLRGAWLDGLRRHANNVRIAAHPQRTVSPCKFAAIVAGVADARGGSSETDKPERKPRIGCAACEPPAASGNETPRGCEPRGVWPKHSGDPNGLFPTMTPAPQPARNISNRNSYFSGLGVCCHRPKSGEMPGAIHRFKTAPATAARPSFHDEGRRRLRLTQQLRPTQPPSSVPLF